MRKRPRSRTLHRRGGRNSESRISNFCVRTESQLTAKARASELPRQTARRWRRDGSLIFVASAKALQIDRHFFRQWQIARVEAQSDQLTYPAFFGSVTSQLTDAILMECRSSTALLEFLS
jgi:hypothetical protein